MANSLLKTSATTKDVKGKNDNRTARRIITVEKVGDKAFRRFKLVYDDAE